MGFLAHLALLSAMEYASRWTRALHLWPFASSTAEGGTASDLWFSDNKTRDLIDWSRIHPMADNG